MDSANKTTTTVTDTQAKAMLVCAGWDAMQAAALSANLLAERNQEKIMAALTASPWHVGYALAKCAGRVIEFHAVEVKLEF